MSTETQRVDVLHVMREASAVLIRDGHKAIPEDLLNAHDAVAELIEADREYDEACQYVEIHGRTRDHERLRDAVHRRKAAIANATGGAL